MEQFILAMVPEDYYPSWQQGQEAEKPHFNPYTGSRRKNSKHVKTMNPQGPPPGMYFLQQVPHLPKHHSATSWESFLIQTTMDMDLTAGSLNSTKLTSDPSSPIKFWHYH